MTLHALTTTGALPHDRFWNHLRARHDSHPWRFDHYHPTLGPLLDRDLLQREGMLGPWAPLFPATPLYRNLYHRIAVNEPRFNHYHPFLSDLLELQLPTRSITWSPRQIHLPVKTITMTPTTTTTTTTTTKPTPYHPAPQHIASAPEPSTMAMAATAALFGLAYALRRSRRAV